MTSPRRKATYDDLCRVPEQFVAEIVDALARTLEVYRSESGRRVVASTHGGSKRIRSEPFDAIDLDISRWWTE
jgi:hypothetical protein